MQAFERGKAAAASPRRSEDRSGKRKSGMAKRVCAVNR